MDPITAAFKEHHSELFRHYGATARGLDWRAEADLELRYDKMLAVIPPSMRASRSSLLDVGCGFGGLYGHAGRRGLEIDYTGIDLVPDMIEHAESVAPAAEFHCADVFSFQPGRTYDFVVCNGILTQKLQASIRDMDRFAQRLIRRMFELAEVGVVFNVMTTKVDWTKDNLYHRHPADLLSWCMAELTDRATVDHSYPLYEYSVYLYRRAVV